MRDDLRPVAVLTRIAGIPREHPPENFQCVLPPTVSNASKPQIKTSQFVPSWFYLSSKTFNSLSESSFIRCHGEISRDIGGFQLVPINWKKKCLCSLNSWLGGGLTSPWRLALHTTQPTSPPQPQPPVKNITGNTLFQGAKFGDVWQLRISQAVFHFTAWHAGIHVHVLQSCLQRRRNEPCGIKQKIFHIVKLKAKGYFTVYQ